MTMYSNSKVQNICELSFEYALIVVLLVVIYEDVLKRDCFKAKI